MRKVVFVSGFLAAAALVTGCGPDEITETLQDAQFDVGGAIVYSGDQELAIADVTIEVVDLGGKIRETTSNEDGLWVLSNLHQGAYVVTYRKDGYESQTVPFTLDALGENDFNDMYVGLGTTPMSETQMSATVSAPFSVTLEDGDFMAHGGPQVLRYSAAGDSLVTVDFNKPLYSGDFSVRISGEFGTVYATPDQARTHWTFSATDIDSVLAPDSDQFTLSSLAIVGAWSYSDIHDDIVALNAEIRFDAVN